MPLQIRRGTNDQRQTELVDRSKPLAPGEPLFVTDDQRLYIGDGTTPGGVLVTGFNAEDATDAAAAALVNGNAYNANVQFVYGLTQDTNNRIEARLDLTNYNGEIGADSFRGTVLATDSSILVNYLTAAINLDGTIKGDAIPFDDATHLLGDAGQAFKRLYVSDEGVFIGQANITGNGTKVNLPADSTVGGVPIAAIAPGVDYQVNIINADSTRIVDAENSAFTGSFTGDLEGSVFANDSSPLVDAIDRKIFANNGLYGDVKNFSDTMIIRGIDSTAMLRTVRFTTDGGTTVGNGVIEANQLIALVDDTFGIVSTTVNASQPVFNIASFNNSTSTADAISLSRSRGTVLSPAIVQNNDQTGNLTFSGYDGSGAYVFGAGIRTYVNGTPAAGIVPMRMVMSATDAAGAETTCLTVEATKVDANLPIKFKVYADATARNAGVPAPEQGMVIYLASTNKLQVNTNGSVGGWVDLN
jgi:hypothetical protein